MSATRFFDFWATSARRAPNCRSVWRGTAGPGAMTMICGRGCGSVRIEQDQRVGLRGREPAACLLHRGPCLGHHGGILREFGDDVGTVRQNGSEDEAHGWELPYVLRDSEHREGRVAANGAPATCLDGLLSRSYYCRWLPVQPLLQADLAMAGGVPI